MQGQQKVLITGAAGLIGSILRRDLADGYQLSGIDRVRIPDFESIVGDTAKMGRRAERAFLGRDVVIDLAAIADADTTWDAVHRNNLPATMNAFEAARRHGVSRVIYASSNHVTGLYEQDEPYSRIVRGEYGPLDPAAVPRITTMHASRPDGPYALGKIFGEATGRYYADEHGLSVICLRIGTCNRSGHPERPRHFATLLTHGDLIRLVVSAIEAPSDVRFGVFYGVSANTWRIWDISDAHDVLGYEPQDDAETWRGESNTN